MANSRFESRSIARRYADALFALADKPKAQDTILAELDSLKSLVSENAELARALTNPTISIQEKGAVVAALADKAKLSDTTRSFLSRVADNNRLDCLNDIADIFGEVVAESRGEVTAEIITAGGVTKKQITDLTKAIEKQLGKKVSANVSENPDILGGVMIKLGSRLLDYSVRGKLQRLEDTLTTKIING